MNKVLPFTQGVNALVFALYRELLGSFMMCLLAYYLYRSAGHKIMIAREHIPEITMMVSVLARGKESHSISSINLCISLN